MSDFIQIFIFFYAIPVPVAWFGIKWNHLLKTGEDRVLTAKDKQLIYFPVLNFFMVFATIIWVIFGVAALIDDYFSDNR